MPKSVEAVPRMAVPMGEYRQTRSPAILSVTGLGSCVALILYVPQARWGALAHTMLPTRFFPGQKMRAKYVGEAIEVLLEELSKAGLKREEAVAKIVGGSKILDLGQDWPQVGERNVAAAIEGLQRCGIPLVAQDVGGTSSRSLEFDLETGLVSVRSMGEKRVL